MILIIELEKKNYGDVLFKVIADFNVTSSFYLKIFPLPPTSAMLCVPSVPYVENRNIPIKPQIIAAFRIN